MTVIVVLCAALLAGGVSFAAAFLWTERIVTAAVVGGLIAGTTAVLVGIVGYGVDVFRVARKGRG